MRKIEMRQEVFRHNQCLDCKYQFEDSCLIYSDCRDCPMYFKPRRDEQTSDCCHCHCLVSITTEERKSGKCKFFKQKED